MRLFMPIIFTALFVLYVLYLAIVRKNLRQNKHAVLYPGLFFIVVWGVIYFELLR